MNLLSREQCFDLLEKHKVPEHIVRHSVQVEKVAVFLAKKLREIREQVNVDLVSRAALLHDIGKINALEKDIPHYSVCQKILEKEGQPELAEIVGKHGLFQVLEEKPFNNLEEKLVNYADKRVTNDQIVSLDERFTYLVEKYGKTKKKAEKILSCKPHFLKIETEIFEKINAGKGLGELK